MIEMAQHITTSDELLGKLKALLATNPRLLVAIDGPSGAGKSTLGASLAEQLPASLVQYDDFYRDCDPAERDTWDAEAGFHGFFDHERLVAEVLAPLQAGSDATFRGFDWHAGAGLTDFEQRIPYGGAVIVEGVYSSMPKLRPYFDVAIWVETPTQVRAERLAARGQHSDTQIDRWRAAEAWYIGECAPAEHADFVIRGVS